MKNRGEIMSIRPIEYQSSLLNSVNEAKNRHVDYNKLKETNQYLQVQLQNEVKRNQKKVVNTHECIKKKVDDDKKEHSQKREEKDHKGKKNSDKIVKTKGHNLDIFI
ncbi:hypothetical protein [Serpentinicella alkaliphila]|nr:hypothetical protein [Serpentinicella alkaliphila]